MNYPSEMLVLVVDDDPDMRRLLERLLLKLACRVILAESAQEGLTLLKTNKPDLIFLDVVMPDMDGYALCAKLKLQEHLSKIPVIFLSALSGEQDKAKAFAVGADDFLTKPHPLEVLSDILKKYLFKKKTSRKKDLLLPGFETCRLENALPDFQGFKKMLFEQLEVAPEKREVLSDLAFTALYEMNDELGITPGQMARVVAKFLGLSYLPFIDPDEIKLGVIPSTFCMKNSIVPVRYGEKGHAVVVSNPFNLMVLNTLEQSSCFGEDLHLMITEPENIDLLMNYTSTLFLSKSDSKHFLTADPKEIEKHPIVHIANSILSKAVVERASDIHITPIENSTMIRFRIDGDLMQVLTVKRNIGVMLVSRFKAIGGLDIAERRKPQDGAIETLLNGQKLKLRLATTDTPHGESLVIRVLATDVAPKLLSELGMTQKQSDTLCSLASRSQGLILLVGPTGSGKTTTIFSLLSHMDCTTRNLISVEDPVEYRIAYANQHQVNEKAGVTFEALLKSSVRQDPDILFIGEIRDDNSARIAVDFASTGHLSISTLHTANATSAIFRLERLGIERALMADSVIGVIAQKLVKTLCPSCKVVEPLTEDEVLMLRPFMTDLPTLVGHPVGCPKCNGTGYYGRVGIYEVLEFDANLYEMIRAGTPISDIRKFVRERGDYLISDHAIEKLREKTLAPKDVYACALIEEMKLVKPHRKIIPPSDPEPQNETNRDVSTYAPAQVMVVEDDEDTRLLICRALEREGYDVTPVEDGIDALMQMGKNEFDLILADVNMPNLDGFELMEMKTQKGVKTPVIFVTGENGADMEIKGFELGAADFIRKPIKKKVLLKRVARVIQMMSARV